MSRILIDGRFVGVGESMTRYCLEVLRGVLALDSENEYTLLIRPRGEKALDDYPGIVGASNLNVDILDIPHYSLPEQTKLLQYLNQKKFDLVHFIQFNHPVRYKRPFVVTVHDLTMIGYLHRSNLLKRLAFGAVMKSAIFDSKKILSVSENSKKEIEEYYHVDPAKTVVTLLGMDHERYNSGIRNNESGITAFKKKYGIEGEYLLYTGAWKKHKNLKRLLEAYEKFLYSCHPERNGVKSRDLVNSKIPQLVLVGKIDQKEPEVLEMINKINNNNVISSHSVASKARNLQFNEAESTATNVVRGSSRHPSEDGIPQDDSQERLKPIVTTGYIEENELPIAYAGALAYVIPSLSEGFGLPPLEAMACGTPVISSEVSCMPEVIGDAAYYFDPTDVSEMAEALSEVVSNEELRKELVSKGFEQVKKYSWGETARKTLEVYNSVLAS